MSARQVQHQNKNPAQTTLHGVTKMLRMEYVLSRGLERRGAEKEGGGGGGGGG